MDLESEDKPLPAEEQLRIICEIIHKLAPGNPVLTPEDDLPKWFAGFLYAQRSWDEERDREVEKLKKEVEQLRRAQPVVEITVSEEGSS